MDVCAMVECYTGIGEGDPGAWGSSEQGASTGVLQREGVEGFRVTGN